MENKEQKKFSQSYSFVNQFVEKLPEIHIKGYSYCGPNTNLDIHIAQGEAGVNELDYACKEHDIVYADSEDFKMRYNADKILVLKAIRRVIAKDAQIGERFSALVVSSFISMKMILSKIEMYIKKKIKNCLARKSKKHSSVKRI